MSQPPLIQPNTPSFANGIANPCFTGNTGGWGVAAWSSALIPGQITFGSVTTEPNVGLAAGNAQLAYNGTVPFQDTIALHYEPFATLPYPAAVGSYGNIPVIPGCWYQFSAALLASMCYGYLSLFWADGAGNYLSEVDSQSVANSNGNPLGAPANLGNYPIVGVIGQAPAGAAYCTPRITLEGLLGNSINPVLYITNTFFSQAMIGSQALTAFSAGAGWPPTSFFSTFAPLTQLQDGTYRNLTPSIGPTGRRQVPNMIIAQFGDGYTQRWPAGLNNNPAQGFLSFDPIWPADADAMELFLEGVAVGRSFYYQLPNDAAPRLWGLGKQGWHRSSPHTMADALTIDLIQQFDF